MISTYKKETTPVSVETELRKRVRQLESDIVALDNENALLKEKMAAVHRSTSWKLTAPIRYVKTLMRYRHYLTSRHTIGIAIRRALEIWQTQGLRFPLTGPEADQRDRYQDWVYRYDRLSDEDRAAIKARIRDFDRSPLISIAMPVYNTDARWLRQAIDSVLSQLYQNWELCIADDCSTHPHVRPILEEYKAKDKRIKVVYRQENGHISANSNSALELATGEFVALLDHDDLLSEHALYYVVEAINANVEADYFYSDEDKINASGDRYAPHFKPDLNPDLLYCQNYICHLSVIRRSILQEIGGFRLGYEGSQDYDLTLRAIAASSFDKVIHIPRILYHWRAASGSTARDIGAKKYALDANRRAILDFFASKNSPAQVIDSTNPVAKRYGFHRVVWPIPNPAPKVSIIIPTRNAYALVKNCVDSLRSITDYPNFDIIIVNNQSDDSDALSYFRKLNDSKAARVIDYDDKFNYSAINNFAVKQAEGEVICLLNNDIEVVEAGWLREMVGHALRPEIGIVGAKLYYPGWRVQHAGVLLGVGGVAGHMFHAVPREHDGYFARAILTQSISAVTGACMVMRKSVFEEVGGLDADNLAVAFNDIDLCLRVREKGYRIIWTPYAELLHLESATRGSDTTAVNSVRFTREIEYMQERWGDTLKFDPYYNPNLYLPTGDFAPSFPPRIEKPWEDIK